MVTFTTLEYTFTAAAQTYSFNYTTDRHYDMFIIEEDYDWLTYVNHYDSNTNSGHLDVTVTQNEGSLRSGKILILAQEDITNPHVEKYMLTVNQNSGAFTSIFEIKEIRIDDEIRTSNFLMTYHPHDVTVIIRASSQLIKSVVYESPQWLQIYSTSETPTEPIEITYVFKVPENDSDNRTGIISFTATDAEGLTKRLEVRFAQSSSWIQYLYADDQYVTYENQTLTIPVQTVNIIQYTVSIGCDWISELHADLDEYGVRVEQNNSGERRSCELTFRYFNDYTGEYETYTINVYQERSTYIEERPIWADYHIPLSLQFTESTDLSSLFYNIYISSVDSPTLIYKGHSYTPNDNNDIIINLTSYIRDYMTNKIYISRDAPTLQSYGYLRAQLYSGNSPLNVNTLIANIGYFYDYSFDKTKLSGYDSPQIRNIPIFDEVDPRQLVLFSVLNLSGETNFIDIDNGTSPYGNVISTPGIHQYIGEPSSEEYIRCSFKASSLTYKVIPTCAKYCLYYLNPLGAYDSLLLDGKNTTNYSYETYSKNNDYDNTTINFYKDTYLKNIVTSYRLTTRYLTDEQSKLIQNVFMSPRAYLHDLEEDTIVPVMINAKTSTLKTFHNQNKKFYYYTIDLEESQQKFIIN